jgi:hypothetical protein
MIQDFAHKYHLALEELQSNFLLGYRRKYVAKKDDVFISMEVIQSATPSALNAFTTIKFECTIDSVDEFVINKTGFLKRIFSKMLKKGVFTIDVKRKTSFYDKVYAELEQRGWSYLSQATLSLKEQKFYLIASAYSEKDLVVVFEICALILDLKKDECCL